MDCKLTYKPYKKTLDFVQGPATQQIFQRVLGLKVHFREVYSGYGKDSSLGRSEVEPSREKTGMAVGGLLREVRTIWLTSAAIASFLITELSHLTSRSDVCSTDVRCWCKLASN